MSGRTRRKNVDASPAADEKPAKRIKSEEEDISVYWEWLGDGAKWQKFIDNSSDIMTKGFSNDVNSVKLKSGKQTIDIIFDRMVQKNTVSGFERDVRCNAATGKNEQKVFQWKDQYDHWNSYDDQIQRLFQACILCKKNRIKFKSHGRSYEADLLKNFQINTATKVKRAVRLLEEDEEISQTSNGSSTVTTGTPGVLSRTVSVIGGVPVDIECGQRNKYHVYSEGENVYDAMLNQTNLKNNNNKFYLMQLLENNKGKTFAVWLRWGRVGLVGQHNLIGCGNDLETAKETFCKKFYDKTRNEFSERDSFEKVEGKYDLLYIDYKESKSKTTDSVDGPASQPIEDKKPVESALDVRIQFLIKLICNVKAMEEAILEMKYDAKKAPLGKLTQEQIKNGYKTLKLIEACIESNQFGDKLIKACDQFYTMIPHCFGMKRPPVIRTTSEVKLKVELLEALEDIEIALKVMSSKQDVKINPIDQHYKSLNCALDPMDHTSEDYKMLNKYLQNTHAKTHNDYKMELQEIFVYNTESTSFKDLGNRKLLWHGSRLTNYVGILSQGLRIAPPEAPVTGYMFGKGVYFADISSKSANYCYASSSKNIGLILLSEVSLGKTNDKLAADYDAADLPSEFDSVLGLGKFAPDPKDDFTMEDGLVVPVGKPKPTGVKNPNGYTLNYNEYIVYNTQQIRPRYLLQVKFTFDF